MQKKVIYAIAITFRFSVMINPIDDRPFIFKTVFSDALTVTCSNENKYGDYNTIP